MNITQLQTLPDSEDETLGGILSNDELMLEISTLCIKYTPEQRIQAATVWTITGNCAEVERQTGIPAYAVVFWKNKTTWWKELTRQIRKTKQDELDGMLTGLIMGGVEALQDRVKNGNHKVYFDEDGQRHEYRVPLTSSELAKDTLGIPFDKRALLRGDPTSRTEKGGNTETQAMLAQLAKNFEAFSKQVRPAYLPPVVVDGEFTEVPTQ
mgnify:CR=1 FL=1